MTMRSIYGQFTRFIKIGKMINFKWKVKNLKTLALLFLTERVKNLVRVNYICNNTDANIHMGYKMCIDE